MTLIMQACRLAAMHCRAGASKQLRVKGAPFNVALVMYSFVFAPSKLIVVKVAVLSVMVCEEDDEECSFSRVLMR
jgi:hypothetical protein